MLSGVPVGAGPAATVVAVPEPPEPPDPVVVGVVVFELLPQAVAATATVRPITTAARRRVPLMLTPPSTPQKIGGTLVVDRSVTTGSDPGQASTAPDLTGQRVGAENPVSCCSAAEIGGSGDDHPGRGQVGDASARRCHVTVAGASGPGRWRSTCRAGPSVVGRLQTDLGCVPSTPSWRNG